MEVEPTLAGRLERLLSDYLDDPAGNLDISAHPVAIQAGTAVVLVRLVDADPPVLRVFSALLHGVERLDDLLAELNEINAHLSFLRVFWRDNTVYAATELLAESVDASTLSHACDAVSDLADYYDVRLHQRFGGELTFG